MKIPRFLAAALLVLCVVSPAHAGKSWQDEKWIKSIKQTSTLLKRGEYAKALEISDRVVKDMAEQLGPGNAAAEAFGIALTHKALALAGLGKKDDALWYWQVVVGLYPPFERSDLSMFGEPGAFLKANVLPPAEGMSTPPVSEATTAPVVVTRVEPRYPHGAYVFGSGGMLIVEVTVTKEGTVHSPRVKKPLSAPTLSYAVLEALRQWRFQPAMKDGEPLEVRFALTVNFVLEAE